VLLAAIGCAGRGRAAPAVETAERVPVGYGAVRTETLTEAVGSIELGDRTTRPRAARIEELLAGRLSGVSVERTTTGELAVRVRGGPSGTGGEPLWVLDGIPLSVSALSAINPDDVARIDVLKGSAGAIYGSRAVHGVVLVTTRRAPRER
jgi:TonB-dependent SusC/RagA subfamily outer membrane receptor